MEANPPTWSYLRRCLESRCVDGGIHIFNSLLDLELFSVKLVFELINGAFKFNNLNIFFKNLRWLYFVGGVD